MGWVTGGVAGSLSLRYDYLKLPCRRRRLGTLSGRGRVALKAWLGIIDLLGGGCTQGLANSTPGRVCTYPAPSSDRVSLRGWVIEFMGHPRRSKVAPGAWCS